MADIGRRAVLAGASVLTGVVFAGGVVAAPRSRLIDRRWRSFGAGSDPDHGAWETILRRSVKAGRDGVARFDYRGTSKGEVEGYVARLAAVDPTALSAAAAFAYWVNLYNAATVQVVLSAYPVRSIRDIGGGLFSGGPWRTKIVEVAGQDLSLDDIEHGILRPVWGDARVHYAVNCASIGCPDLAGRAYSSKRLGAMLDTGARGYINHPRGARISAGKLVVSSIYDWFQADFGGNDVGVIAHMKLYAASELAGGLNGVSRISEFGYDWALNDV